MLTKKEKEIVIRCAKRYQVSSVFLFGSSIARRNGHDIDLGVRGIKPKLFFKLYADLFRYLPRPVDLIDLDSESNYFTKRIIAGGKVIYEA
jgi:predicted nucleotidyltransferase